MLPTLADVDAGIATQIAGSPGICGDSWHIAPIARPTGGIVAAVPDSAPYWRLHSARLRDGRGGQLSEQDSGQPGSGQPGEPTAASEPSTAGQPDFFGTPDSFGTPDTRWTTGSPGTTGAFGQAAPVSEAHTPESWSKTWQPGETTAGLPGQPGQFAQPAQFSPPGQYSQPGGGYQPWGQQPPGMTPRTNPVSIGALICGLGQFLLGLLVVGNILLAVPAIILGVIGIKQTAARGEHGRGMAVAGLVLGILGVFYFILVIVIIVAFGTSVKPN
jgi:Domain of unknown function (DUF4190)